MKTIVSVAIGILAVVAILLPLCFFVAGGFLLPSQYTKSFYGELDDKVARLDSLADQNKIVIIGGSSVAFGLDSEKIEAELGLPVVNFGLYADLGTKLMLDLSEDSIKAGDIVILAPELDPQTLSMYFSGRSTWMAIDDEPTLVFRLKKENMQAMWGGLWQHTMNKLGFLLKDDELDPNTVYNSKYFNKYGDLVYGEGNGAASRLNCEMILQGGYDKTTLINPDIEIFDEEFLAYLNEYIDKMTERGAKVFFNYCPMNRAAIVGENGQAIGLEGELPFAKIDAFEASLKNLLHCPVIGEFADYAYDPGYCYDTNFHMNARGVLKHTGNLIVDLRHAFGSEDFAEADLGFTVPAPLDMPKFFGDTEKIYEVDGLLLQADVLAFAKVIGVSASGLVKKTIVLPKTLMTDEGVELPVSVITEGAFSACTVTENVVISDTPMSMLENNAFAGSSIKNLYLYCPVAGFTPGTFINGTDDSFMIHICSAYYFDYLADYAWESITQFSSTEIVDSYEELLGRLPS